MNRAGRANVSERLVHRGVMPNFSRCCRRHRRRRHRRRCCHRRYCRRRCCRRCRRRCRRRRCRCRRTSASILRRSVLKSNSLASGTKEGFDAVYFEEEKVTCLQFQQYIFLSCFGEFYEKLKT